MKTIYRTAMVAVAGLCAISNAVALQGGSTAIGTPFANSTVWVQGCTGTLIQPNLVLTSGHCLTDRVKPTGHADFDHGCSDWEQPGRWYQLAQAAPVSIGRDSQNWLFRTQANSYTLPGCLNIILSRLDDAVPAWAATPAKFVTRPGRTVGRGLQVVG